jgi:hypothetical protein
MKITALARFNAEMALINKKLDTVENPKVKLEAEKLISDLKKIINDINVAHDGTVNGYMNPHIVSHKRHTLISIRERLYKLLNIPLKSKRTT